MIITGASCGSCRNSQPETEKRGEKWRAKDCRGCFKFTSDGTEYRKFAPAAGYKLKYYDVVRWDGKRYQQGVVKKTEAVNSAASQI